MLKSLNVLLLATLLFLRPGEVGAEIGYIGPDNTSKSESLSSSSSNTTQSTSHVSAAVTSMGTADKSSGSQITIKRPVRRSAALSAVCGDASCAAAIPGVAPNIQATSVQVEPSSGSASLSIPIEVPPGRAGIQPHVAVVYNSSNRQLGNAGVGWTLDLGSIQISTKHGVPQYDGTDIFTIQQNGSTQDLVADPNTSNLYHLEVEGAFANIQYNTTYWVMTDKKGIKYYYGNTSDSKQVVIFPRKSGHKEEMVLV